MHRHGSPQATAETYARDGARHRPRRPLPLGRQAVLRLRARQLADVPARASARTAILEPRPADARRRRRARCATEQPTLFFASPGFVAALLDADVPASRRSRRCGRRSRPARRCRPTCSGASPSASAIRCSTASARPRRCTSSCRTARATSGPARAARRSPGYDARARRRRRRRGRPSPTRPGYLHVRGPSIATGYWQRAEATARGVPATAGCAPATCTRARPTATGRSSAATAT